MFALPTAPRRRESRRVLVVDDDALFAESIGCFLAYEDLVEVVGYASDGREAIARAASLRPDVVVMDLEMPRMDGFEATARIRRELEGVAVVVLSSSARADDVRRARAAGAVAFVRKSRAAEELVAAILAARPPAEAARRPIRRERMLALRPARAVKGRVDLAPGLRGHAGDALELLG